MDGSWEESRMFVQHELERLGEEQGKQWKAISEIQRDVAALKEHANRNNPGYLRIGITYGGAGSLGGLIVTAMWLLLQMVG